MGRPANRKSGKNTNHVFRYEQIVGDRYSISEISE